MAIEQEIIQRLYQGAPRILLTTHWNPDGDAIGATLGLAHYLRAQGMSVQAIFPNAPSRALQQSPGYGAAFTCVHYEDAATAEQWIVDADLHIALDYNTPNRVGHALSQALQRFQGESILIDHHPEPDPSYHYLWSNTSKGSTCEMVADLIAADGDLNSLDVAAAENLLMGLITDSGSFRFPSTSAHTLRIAATLMDQGIHPNDIHARLYESSSEGRLQLFGRGLAGIQFVANGQAALITLTHQDMLDCQYQSGDTEGLVNWGLSVAGVRVSALLREDEPGVLKCSFRSTGNADVNAFARQHFNGGGHRNAAGGRSESTLAEASKRFIDHIEEIL